ncbi:CsbD family protein [Phormidium nigroviride]
MSNWHSKSIAGDRRQKAEGRRQKAEGRRQKAGGKYNSRHGLGDREPNRTLLPSSLAPSP